MVSFKRVGCRSIQNNRANVAVAAAHASLGTSGGMPYRWQLFNCEPGYLVRHFLR